MTGIFLFALIALLAIVVVGRLLDRLLDFDELAAFTETEDWSAKAGETVGAGPLGRSS